MNGLLLEPSSFQLSSCQSRRSMYCTSMLDVAMANSSTGCQLTSPVGQQPTALRNHQTANLPPYYQHPLLGAYAYDVLQHHHALSHHHHNPHHAQGSSLHYGSTTSGLDPTHSVTCKSTNRASSCKSAVNIKNRQSVIQVATQAKSPSSSSGNASRAVSTSVVKSKKILSPKDMERKRDLANKQERRRMHRLNDALNRLRQIIPNDTNARRMSKIKTLQSAINYIYGLQELLKEH